MRTFLARLFIALWAVTVAGRAFAQETDKLVVFAASSLTEALNDVGEAYAKTGKAKPVFSYAASSALAKQIENGAPAAMFVSADEMWMDYLGEHKLIVADTRKSFLGNTLVLIAPADRPLHIAIAANFPLAKAIGAGKLSLADPDAVPAGKYGKAALESLGVWKAVEGNVIRGENVRSALAFVERGEAAAGIVYSTDAALTNKVMVAGAFPDTSYPPISYPLAIVAGHDSPGARAFRDFMLGDAAKAVYRKYGFAVK